MRWELLEGVPEEDVQRVLVMARRRSFGRGEVVFHQDDPADSLHLVVAGRFAMSRRTELGEQALLAIRGRGEAFGELALVSEQNRSAAASALEAGETLCVHRIDFERLRVLHPAVDRILVSLLARQLQRTNQLLSEALYVSAERRVLRRLLELGPVYGGREGEQAIPITQEQLAALAGASRATVNAVLSTERRRGTIEVRRGATLVLDQELWPAGPAYAGRASEHRSGRFPAVLRLVRAGRALLRRRRALRPAPRESPHHGGKKLLFRRLGHLECLRDPGEDQPGSS